MFHFPNDADKTIKFWLLLSWSWFVTSSLLQLGLWISAVFFLHPKHKIDAVVILVLYCFVVAWGVISHICLSMTVQKKRSTKQIIRLLNVFLVYKMTVIFLNCAGVVLFSIWFFRYGYAGMFLFFPEAVTCQFFWKYGRVLKEVRKEELAHVASQPVFVVSQHYRLPLNEDKADLPLAPPSYREKCSIPAGKQPVSGLG